MFRLFLNIVLIFSFLLITSEYVFVDETFAHNHGGGRNKCKNKKWYGLSHKKDKEEKLKEFVPALLESNGKNRENPSIFRRFVPGKKIKWCERYASEEESLQILYRYEDYNDIPKHARTPLKRLIDWTIIAQPQEGDFFRPNDVINKAEFFKLLIESTGVQKRIPQRVNLSQVRGTV